MDLIDELEQITTAFNKAEIEFALCGGLAMAAHGLIRATEDMNVIVRLERSVFCTGNRGQLRFYNPWRRNSAESRDH